MDSMGYDTATRRMRDQLPSAFRSSVQVARISCASEERTLQYLLRLNSIARSAFAGVVPRASIVKCSTADLSRRGVSPTRGTNQMTAEEHSPTVALLRLR